MLANTRIARKIVLFVAGSSLLGIGSCLGLDLSKALRFGAVYVVDELVFDNDTAPFLDLFED